MTQPERHTCCALRLIVPDTIRLLSGTAGLLPDRHPAAAERRHLRISRKRVSMEPKYEEMARQMRADGVSEETIARFVAEEMEEDGALREWRKIPEHIRKLLLANAFCHNCGTTELAPGYTLRMRHGCVLIEGRCAECGAEVARLCD